MSVVYSFSFFAELVFCTHCMALICFFQLNVSVYVVFHVCALGFNYHILLVYFDVGLQWDRSEVNFAGQGLTQGCP